MFVVRVELKNVPPLKARDVYDNFHIAMEKAGFSKKIQSGDKKWYRLPDATYISRSNSDRATVLEQVRKLATATGYDSGVIVFDAGDATWNGLELIPATSLFANA